MFVREQIVKRGKAEYRYLKVVESIREGATNCQNVLVNLGNVAGWPAGKLDDALKLLADFVGLDVSQLADVQSVRLPPVGAGRWFCRICGLSYAWTRLSSKRWPVVVSRSTWQHTLEPWY